MKLSDLLWAIGDWIVPRSQPLSKAELQKEQSRRDEELAECNKRVAALPEDEETLVGYLRECAKLSEAEEERRRSVEARLTSIVGLSSIAATIVFGSILAQAAGTLYVQQAWLRWTMAAGALYLALQLCCAIFAAVGGLERQSYLSTATQDIFPLATGEDRSVYLRRRILNHLTVLLYHQSLNNRKVTQMAVAHRAIRNFLWLLLTLALVGAYGGLKSYKTKSSNKITKSTSYATAPVKNGDEKETVSSKNCRLIPGRSCRVC